MGQAEPRPTKREWLKAFMDGLKRSRYTGSVDIRLTYRNGDITLVIPTVKDETARAGDAMTTVPEPGETGEHHGQRSRQDRFLERHP